MKADTSLTFERLFCPSICGEMWPKFVMISCPANKQTGGLISRVTFRYWSTPWLWFSLFLKRLPMEKVVNCGSSTEIDKVVRVELEPWNMTLACPCPALMLLLLSLLLSFSFKRWNKLTNFWIELKYDSLFAQCRIFHPGQYYTSRAVLEPAAQLISSKLSGTSLHPLTVNNST